MPSCLSRCSRIATKWRACGELNEDHAKVQAGRQERRARPHARQRTYFYLSPSLSMRDVLLCLCFKRDNGPRTVVLNISKANVRATVCKHRNWRLPQTEGVRLFGQFDPIYAIYALLHFQLHPTNRLGTALHCSTPSTCLYAPSTPRQPHLAQWDYAPPTLFYPPATPRISAWRSSKNCPAHFGRIYYYEPKPKCGAFCRRRGEDTQLYALRAKQSSLHVAFLIHLGPEARDLLHG